jgi:polyphosphate kinase 2 (PPK2 family)
VRVHPELLARQRLPAPLVTKDIWRDRFEDVKAFERHLARNGTLVLKFFLHMSKREQRRRLLQRLDEPSKNWKFQLGDLDERARWDDYMHAYEQVLTATSTRHAPWFIVPADHKWFTRLTIAELIVHSLESLDLRFPPMTKERRQVLAEARRRLAGRPPRAMR